MRNRNLFLKILSLTFLTLSAANSQQTDNSLELTANQQEYLSQIISPSYLLELPLNDSNCEASIGQRCNYKDGITGGDYFHPVTLVVFQNKVMAIQSFKDGRKTLIRVINSNYTLKTKNDNLVSFTAKEGDVSNLKLSSGTLAKEVKADDLKCNKAKFLYDFYNLYHKESQIAKKTGSYMDEYDFKGIKEYIIFAPKDNITDAMAIISTQTGATTIENLLLCQLNGYKELRVRHISKQQCLQNPTNEECSRYQNCEDKVKIKDCTIELFVDGFETN